MPRDDARLHHAARSPAARRGSPSSVRQAFSFSSISAEIGQARLPGQPQQFVAGAEGVLQHGVVELDAVRADRVLVDDEAAAHRVVRLLQQRRRPRRRTRRASCRSRGTAASLRRCRTRSSSIVEGDLVASPISAASSRSRFACGSAPPARRRVSTSTVRGESPSRPSSTALGVPWPWPVAPSEPNSSARTDAVCASRPSFLRRRANMRAARIGPTVWELDGPMPIENRSKTRDGHGDSSVRWWCGVLRWRCSGASVRGARAPAARRRAGADGAATLLAQARVQRVLLGESRDPGASATSPCPSKAGLQRLGDDVGDLAEVLVLEAAGGQRRRADPQARGDHRRTRVVRDGVAVDRDADLVEAVLGLLAVQLGLLRRSTRTRCTSVPPDSTETPALRRRPAARSRSARMPCAVQGALLALLELLATRRP